jgi:hypothetical protein
MDFWGAWAEKTKAGGSNPKAVIANYIDGGILDFEAEPMTRVKDGALQKLAGLAGSQWVQIHWPEGKPYNDGLVQHEVAHECRRGLGVEQPSEMEEHAAMKEAGFPY